MKKIFFYTFMSFMVVAAPKLFAQATSNTDFNPFPQMEQDQDNVDEQTAPQPQQQNDDAWPPANSDTQANNGGET